MSFGRLKIITVFLSLPHSQLMWGAQVLHETNLERPKVLRVFF